MKRKREISRKIDNNENDRAGLHQEINNSNHNVSHERPSVAVNQVRDHDNVQHSVAISKVFNRFFEGLDQTSITNNSNAREGCTTTTPKTPSNKRRCILGKDGDLTECVLHKISLFQKQCAFRLISFSI